MFSGNVLKETATPPETNVTDSVEDIPDDIYWHSLLTAMQESKDFHSLQCQVEEWYRAGLRPLKPRVMVTFRPGVDAVNSVAQKEIPHDGPVNLRAFLTTGDGNCLGRSLGKGYFSDDTKHIEVRARIVIEGIIRKKHYLLDQCLERGASVIHHNADLPTVFATFSEYYTPGQKLTPEAVNYIYSMEIFECSHLGAYMGIWQLAQASSVFGVPLHAIYPVRGESTIRHDFHRIFFPIDYPTDRNEEPLVIMWTGLRVGAAPIHFVPLLPIDQ